MSDHDNDIREDSSPTPPPAPEIAPILEGGASGSSERRGAAEQRRGRRHWVSRSTIVVVVAVIVVLIGAYAGFGALGAAQSKPVDTRLSDSPSNGSDSSKQTSSEEEAVEKEAKASVQSALDSLANDEDGQFRACVESFINDYDAGVSADSYALSDLDVTPDALAALLRSEFECTVVKIDVYNGTAWVDVDVTSKSISAATESFARSVASAALECDDEQEYLESLKDALFDAFERQKPRTTRVLLTIAQSDDGWVLGDSDKATIFGAAWSA